MDITKVLVVRKIKNIIGFPAYSNFLLRYFYQCIDSRSLDNMECESCAVKISQKLIGAHFDYHILLKDVNTL
jgi:hypothetical protein